MKEPRNYTQMLIHFLAGFGSIAIISLCILATVLWAGEQSVRLEKRHPVVVQRNPLYHFSVIAPVNSGVTARYDGVIESALDFSKTSEYGKLKTDIANSMNLQAKGSTTIQGSTLNLVSFSRIN